MTGSDAAAWTQTVFSVAALIAALAIALREHRRATRAETARARAFRSAVGSLLTQALERTDQLRRSLQEDPRQDDRSGRCWAWRDEIELIRESVEAVRPTAPPDPDLALAMTRVSRILARTEGVATTLVVAPSRVDDLQVYRDELASEISGLADIQG